MNSSTTMSSAMKRKTTPSLMMTTILIAARTNVLGVVRFQVAPPRTPWFQISVLERHLWRLK